MNEEMAEHTVGRKCLCEGDAPRQMACTHRGGSIHAEEDWTCGQEVLLVPWSHSSRHSAALQPLRDRVVLSAGLRMESSSDQIPPQRVVLVDYGMGNLRSVANAFEVLGCLPSIAQSPRELAKADKVVLPGVGAFGDAMANLKTQGWVSELEEVVRVRGKPFLGLCLGLQLLATRGTEHGEHEGLGWLPGVVERIVPADPRLRVPHIGWNNVRVTKRGGLYAGSRESPVFYFVHSFAFRPQDTAVVSGTCDYGGEVVASVEAGNLFATQYHPEKSQRDGLAVLRNFLRL